MEGWIKLHRQFLDHWLCDEYTPLTKREAWENIIIWANISDNKVLIKGEVIECKRGQLCFSLETWSKKFNWSVSQVRQFFKLLENDKMITIEGMKYTTRLTVSNYDTYQEKKQTENKLKTNSLQTDCILPATSKEEEEIKKKKNIYDFVSIDFSETFSDWLDYKKSRKESYKSENSIKASYDKLIRLSGNNPNVAKLIVNESMANNWAGIFELKQKNNINGIKNNF